MEYLFGILLAALAGVLMALQGTFNAALSRKIGLWETNFLVHLVGVLILVLLVFLFKIADGNWRGYNEAPWYAYLGGLLGILIIYTVAASIPRLGVTLATTSIVTAQLISAALIDQFGLFMMEKVQFSVVKGIGLVLIIIGARLILHK